MFDFKNKITILSKKYVYSSSRECVSVRINEKGNVDLTFIIIFSAVNIYFTINIGRYLLYHRHEAIRNLYLLL